MSDAIDTRIGVVVPNKNGAAFLGDALRSITTQDRPVEYIVMDSESTDGSYDVARSFGARWISQADTCAAQAINRGWAMLDAPILAWLNSDDMWAPGAVSRVVKAFEENPDADVISGECLMIEENGDVIALRPTGPFDLVRSLTRADHILNQPAVFMKRSALESVGWLREIWLHDHDLWLRLALTARFAHIPDVLAYGRERAGNLGRNADLVAKMRVQLISDFFARDDVPAELMRLRRTSMSWAHIRAAQSYVDSRYRLGKGLRHLGSAVVWDPLNVAAARAAVRRGFTAVGRRVGRARRSDEGP